MTRLDFYLLNRMIILFLFFTLVLSAVFWVNIVGRLMEHALPSFNDLLPLLTYFFLFLPKSVTVIMPISGFAAVTYLTYRLIINGELAAIQATAGFNTLRFLRPYLVFTILLFLLASVFTHLFTPASRTVTESLDRHVIEVFNLSNIRTGEFLFPADGIAIFIESLDVEPLNVGDADSHAGDAGSGTRFYENVFIHDRRSADFAYSIFAERAYLLELGEQYLIVLLDGHTERLDNVTRELSLLTFEKSILRVTIGSNRDVVRNASLDQITSYQLLNPDWFDPPLSPAEIKRAFIVLNERTNDSLVIALAAFFGGAIVYSFGMVAMSRNFALLVAILVVITSYIVGESAVSYVETYDGYWLFAYASSFVLVLATLACLVMPRRHLRHLAFLEHR